MTNSAGGQHSLRLAERSFSKRRLCCNPYIVNKDFPPGFDLALGFARGLLHGHGHAVRGWSVLTVSGVQLHLRPLGGDRRRATRFDGRAAACPIEPGCGRSRQAISDFMGIDQLNSFGNVLDAHASHIALKSMSWHFQARVALRRNHQRRRSEKLRASVTHLHGDTTCP